jgi:hypothetical protein
MTLPLPYLVKRSRLMKLAIAASCFTPKRGPSRRLLLQ